MLVSVEQIANEFDRTARFVQQLHKKHGMPREKHGEYDLEKCKTWYIRFLQDKIAHKAGEGDGADAGEYNNDREQFRLTRAKADIAEIELAEKRGEVIPLKDLENALARMVTQARQQLLQLPGRVAPALEGEPRAVIKSKLQQHVHAALTALSKPDEHSAKHHA